MQNSPSTSTIAFSYLARSLAALDTGHLPKSKPHAAVRTTYSPTWGNGCGQSVVCVGIATTVGGALALRSLWSDQRHGDRGEPGERRSAAFEGIRVLQGARRLGRPHIARRRRRAARRTPQVDRRLRAERRGGGQRAGAVERIGRHRVRAVTRAGGAESEVVAA